MTSPILSDDLLQSAVLIAQEAGKHIRHFYHQSIVIQTKSDKTPVTEADLFVSQFLTEKLTALTPDVPILSEENCDISLKIRSTWTRYWIIDPLDGTQQFINHSGQFSVLLALVENNTPILGIIHAPILGCTYYAMRGCGAFKTSRLGTQKLIPRHLDLIKPLKIIVGSSKKIEQVRSCLNPNFDYEFQVFGSSGLKSALVAEGIADCYVRLGNTGEWDTAAAEVLLAETNGVIFDRTFTPLSYNQRETFINPDFVMSADKQIKWGNIFQFNKS